MAINPLTPNDTYSGRTAPLTSKRCILYIYSTNTGTEYFKHDIYCPFFSLQNAVCFIILIYLVPVLFTFYIQGGFIHILYTGCAKILKNNSDAKRLIKINKTSVFKVALSVSLNRPYLTATMQHYFYATLERSLLKLYTKDTYFI